MICYRIDVLYRSFIVFKKLFEIKSATNKLQRTAAKKVKSDSIVGI